MNNCPCGSGNLYTACCEPIITDARVATTAEELMRARYAAHVAVQVDFIFESTHPDHRQEFDRATTEKWSKDADWLGLEILATTKGGADDNTGEVEFTARFREEKELRLHHELALFEKKDGRWYFTDGSLVRPKPLVANKIGRNDPCTCGSGQKYKKCCGK